MLTKTVLGIAASVAILCSIAPYAQAGEREREIILRCAKQGVRNIDEMARCTGGLLVPHEAFLSCARGGPCDVSRRVNAGREMLRERLNLSREQRVLADCVVEYRGNARGAANCAASGLYNQHLSKLTPEQRVVMLCAVENRGSVQEAAMCTTDRLMGGMSKDQQILARCAMNHIGDWDGAKSCVIRNYAQSALGNMNPEWQIAAECAVKAGGNPKGTAVCAATRLTARELQKCASQGIGGDGCFGRNNTLRRMLADASGHHGPTNDLFGNEGWVAKRLGTPLPSPPRIDLPRIEVPRIELPKISAPKLW